MRPGRGCKLAVQGGITALAVVAGLIAPSTASANTVLRVDAVHGHDTGNCLSSPCKTLAYAVGQGRMIPDLITIEAAPGTYTGDVALGAADSGLSIIGVGSGTNPAKNTIIKGVSGNPTFNATTSGDASSLSLANLRIVNPAGDTSPAVDGSATNLRLSDVPVLTPGGGPGLVDSNADLTLTKSPITLGTAGGSALAISGGGLSLTLSSSPIDVKGNDTGIVNGNGPVRLTNSPVTLENTSGTGNGIVNGGAAVTLTSSAVDVKGTGTGIVNGSAPVTLTNSPVTLENTSGTGNGIVNGGAAVTLTSSAVDVKGTGTGIVNGSAPVTVSKSPITLENTSGSGAGIVNGGAAVAVSQSPITVHGKGAGIINGGAPVTVSSSAIKLLGTSGSSSAIVNGGAAVTVSGSALLVKGGGGGIINGGAPVTVISSPITLTKVSGTGVAIDNGGATVLVQGSNIDLKGTGPGIENGGGTTTLSSLQETLENAANTDPALVTGGGGSALSHVTISGSWSGPAISDGGSLSIADSTLTSGPSPIAPFVIVSDGGAQGRDISVTRSRLTERSTTEPDVEASNVDMATVSSALLGGSTGVSFGVTGGVVRTLTVVSSTVDAGVLGTRDASPIKSIAASSDNTSGSLALVNIEGSILVEAPAATRGGTSGAAQVNCTHTEVPSTSQASTSSLGFISCASGSFGNTFTSSLSAIFASPITSYKLKPSWSGVDSVPASAISVPSPFSDSATDLLGHPRVLNGSGTCLPGVRDKGAIELTGHGGVVPKPVISGPSHGLKGAKLSFKGKAPNLPHSVHAKFTWHTSDGASGTGSHFSHSFERAGKFKVSLTATGGTACTASVSKKVRISAPKSKHSTRQGQSRAVQATVGRNSPYRRETSRTTS